MTTSTSEINNVLTNMITEKGQSVDTEVVRDGHFGLTWQHLIDFCDQISPADQQNIINTITKIDFHNGDVFHFLNYLVDGMIKALKL